MATITLARFLKERNLLDRFLSGLGQNLIYLREILGDKFLKDPAQESFGSLGPWDSREYVTVSNYIGADRVFKEDDEEEYRGDDPDYKEEVEHDNLLRIFRHLAGVEARLLGSVPAEDGKRWKTCHGKEVTPVQRGHVPPFASLLRAESLDWGPGGEAGGYRNGGFLPYYHMPVDGKERVFNAEEFHKRLLRFARGCGGVLTSEHCILMNHSFSMVMPQRWGMHNDGNEHLYGEAGETRLQPRIRFSQQMPYNAIYVFKPNAMKIHALDLCRVKTNDSGRRVIFSRTRIAQSLFHHADNLGTFYTYDESGNRRETERPDSSRHHFAYLAVRPGPEADLDQFKAKPDAGND